MGIRWKWLRDLASLAFSGYYLLFANEADEKVRSTCPRVVIPSVSLLRRGAEDDPEEMS